MPNRFDEQVPEWDGFANSPRDEDGKALDFRDVPAYDAERDEALKAPSSIAQFKTSDQSTDGSPMAVVPPPTGVDPTGTEPDEDEVPVEESDLGDAPDGDDGDNEDPNAKA